MEKQLYRGYFLQVSNGVLCTNHYMFTNILVIYKRCSLMFKIDCCLNERSLTDIVKAYPVHTFHTEEQITLQTKPSLHKTCKRYNKIIVTTSQPNKHTNVRRNKLRQKNEYGNK